MEISDAAIRQGRVLVAESVFEDATLTVRDGRLYIEFEAADLDSIAVQLSDLAESPAAG